jgi:hypothetical protein
MIHSFPFTIERSAQSSILGNASGQLKIHVERFKSDEEKKKE